MRFLLYPLLILLVFVRFFSTRPSFQDGQKVRVTGIVRQEPVRFSYYQKISLANLKIYLPRFPEIDYGDKIKVEGVIQKGELSDAVLLGKEEKRGVLSGLRKKVVEFFQKSLPEPHASLVAGMTLGAKTSLPKDFWDSLTKTGTAHVVVASGMNVTLVASFLIGALVLWTVPYITIAGTLAAVFGSTIPFLGRTLLILCFPLTTWFITIVNIFS